MFDNVSIICPCRYGSIWIDTKCSLQKPSSAMGHPVSGLRRACEVAKSAFSRRTLDSSKEAGDVSEIRIAHIQILQPIADVCVVTL